MYPEVWCIKVTAEEYKRRLALLVGKPQCEDILWVWKIHHSILEIHNWSDKPNVVNVWRRLHWHRCSQSTLSFQTWRNLQLTCSTKKNWSHWKHELCVTANSRFRVWMRKERLVSQHYMCQTYSCCTAYRVCTWHIEWHTHSHSPGFCGGCGKERQLSISTTPWALIHTHTLFFSGKAATSLFCTKKVTSLICHCLTGNY